MTKVDHSNSFYQKMAELQEKLKRSEEERMKLEEKFSLMMKSCREEEEKRILALRERYEKFLEDDKRRRDRNERILQTLEKIESRASALSAKSERLKLLRRHYEAYLVRMYPLWKKQTSSISQPSVPTNYQLCLPMDAEKGLPWFGGSTGLYTNNTHLPSARSSLSPGSDQMWVPPVLSRNIPTYDNSKQTIIPKPMERKNSVMESSSPAVEGALDNYLQRAAELLRIPVEELEGHSEKHDEEKSVHTEQDTSRDLLNVSLSDDSILFEKKAEKTRGNTLIDNTKEYIGKIIEEKKCIQEIDHLAGGDNMLSNFQTDVSFQQDGLNQPKVARSSRSAQEKNVYNNSSDIESDIPNVNKNISDIQSIHSEQELLTNSSHKKSALPEDYEEELPTSALHNLHAISDKNLEYNNVDNIDTQEPFASAAHQEYIDNTFRNNVYENVQLSDSNIQEPSNDQLNLSNVENESLENVDHLHYALEQESANEEQEYIENLGQNINELSQQNVDVPQEFIRNQDGTIRVTKSEEQPPIAVDESVLENDQHNEEYTGIQYSSNNQNYVSQNTGDIEQYEQEQYVANSNLHFEQYPNNTQHYEQEQYIGDEEQLYNQQYLEQYGENSGQLEEECMDNEENLEQCGASKEGHLIGPTRHEQNDHNLEGENINEEQMYVQNEGQNYSADSEGESQEHVASSQPAPDKGTDGDLVNIYHTEIEGEEAFQKDTLDDQECASKEYELKQESSSTLDDQILETQEGEAKSNIMHQETKEHVEGESKVKDQQNLDMDAAEQALTKPDNPSAIEDDSEESSTGFWNPPYHSSIPSVDELAPKSAVVVETSESSADSKMGLSPDKPLGSHTVQQFHTLLGVPSDPAGDSVLSDQDDVEDQLAALVEDPTVRSPTVVETRHDTTKDVKQAELSKTVKEGKPVTVVPPKSKSQKHSKISKSSESAKPLTRTGLKKPPSLIKVLDSDTESLNLDTGAASNVDSDEFDFSTE